MLSWYDFSFPLIGRNLPWDLAPHVKWGSLCMLPQSSFWTTVYTIILVTWWETWLTSREAVGLSANSIWANLNKKLVVVGEKSLGWKEMPGCNGVLKSRCQTLKWECSDCHGMAGMLEDRQCQQLWFCKHGCRESSTLFTCLQKFCVYLILVCFFFRSRNT